MVTIFSSPRPFLDAHISMIQRNAIRSWLALRPRPQVLLLGDDAGVADVAREFSVTHIGEVDTDKRGIPMRSSMFRLAHDSAVHDHLCIINADIIILGNLCDALKRIPLEQFVAAGRRYDLAVRESIAFENGDWRTNLRAQTRQEGTLRGPSAIDYAVYSKSIVPIVMPPFPVNSFGWDPWFLFEHRRRGIPVVNLSQMVSVVHQKHESREQARLKQARWRKNADAMAALQRAGGFSSMMTLREADYVLTRSGLRRPLSNRILSTLSTTRVYRGVLGCKRHLQRFRS